MSADQGATLRSTGDRPGPAVVIVSTLLSLAFLYVVLIGGGYPASAYLTARIAIQAISIAVVGVWVVAVLVRPGWWPTSPLARPVALVLGAMALSTVLSPEPWMAAGGLAFAALASGAFLLVAELSQAPPFARRIAGLLVLLPIIVLAAYAVQVVAAWLQFWSLVGRFTLPPLRPDWAGLAFGSPNLVATVLVVATPIACVLIAMGGDRRRTRSLAALALGVAAVVAIGVTGSRGGALALAATAVTAAALALTITGRASRRAIATFVALAAVVGGALLVVLLARGGQGGEGLRVELWRTAIVVFLDHPIAGSGPDTWAMLKLAEGSAFEPNNVVHHAHNLFVWTLAELGIVGFVATATLVVMTVRLLVRRAFGGEAWTAAIAVAALASLAGVAAQSVVDVVTNLPSTVLLLAVVVAFAVHASPAGAVPAAAADDPSDRQTSLRLRRLGAALAAMGLVAVSIGSIRADQAVVEAQAASADLLRGNDASALDGYRSAYALDPLPLYEGELGVTAAFLGDRDAATTWSTSAAAVDALANRLVLLAGLQAAGGDAPAAVATAERAMDLGWPDAGVMLNVSKLGEQVDEDLAERALVLAAAIAPTSLRDPYWQSPERSLPYDELVRQAAVVAAAHFGPAQAAMVLAYGGNPSAATDAAAALPAKDRERTNAIVTSVTDGTAGIGRLTQLLEADPLDWVTAGWLARLEMDAGDASDATRHATWARMVQGDVAPGLQDLPRSIGGDRELPQVRLPGLYPGAVYDRPWSGLVFGPGSVTLVP